MDIRTVREIPELKDKRVLVRVDWNVPIQDGKVTDDFRIRQSLPTVNLLREAGAKLVLISHLESEESKSLKPVYERAKELLPLTFEEESDCVLLENLRLNPGEKVNDEEFARELASKGDIFVNEAFSVAHRSHASVVGVPKFLPSYMGLEFAQELEKLSQAFHPEHPFLFILGGAKFDTKLPLINKFLNIADTIYVAGALANNFFKDAGMDIKKSYVSQGDFPTKKLMETGKIMLPRDYAWMDDRIVDAGPESLEDLKAKIAGSETVLWNGPLGEYEVGAKEWTLELAKALAESGKKVIVGGGDTLAAIEELDLFDKFFFVSTGGGAMLDFLANETLPGIEALRTK